MDYDAIIIGAGHNGLVAAFYLARAGLRVLVLEARAIVGGSCVTEELIPGYRFSTCANVVWAMRPQIIADMGLHERGLTVDTRQFLRLLPDGRYLFTERLASAAPGAALTAIQHEIARFSAADAAAFPGWVEFLARLTRILGPWLLDQPPQLHAIYARCADAADRQALDLVLTNSIAALADRFFESEVMRDVGVAADIGDVYDRGTGLLFALTTAMGAYSETGAPVLNGFIRGGMGRLTELIAEAACEQGASIRTCAPVARVLIERGQAQGVELASGERISARLVISNADPKRTFLSLIDAEALDPHLLGRVQAIQTHAAAGLKLHCALGEMLEYRLDRRLSDQQLREATLIIAPNRAYRQAAWQAAAQGELPEQPVIAGFLPSVYDPTLAPPGGYTWSAYVVWVPVTPRRGTWADRKDEMAERLFSVMQHYAPNFRRALKDYVLITPEYLQQHMLLTDGNIHHVDAIPSQLLWQRPLAELAHYRTPIGGLYLCGAGTHPWGEVSGAPGYNAAHAILSDLAPGDRVTP
ncbi:MAG: NAD(P)/FAD-dependent oxidoreductase [Kouleothrix sp.]|jgi:phytoene dehydrogenase-like protein|nr:NAD(P)/FAD-dependent oxidoreductase [Kouleothrix sp.]